MELLHNVSRLESQKREVPPHRNSLYWRIGWSLAAAAGCAALAACGLKESLWLDELHTSWAMAGSFEDVLPRSQQGNQTPLYANLVKTWTLGLGRLGLLQQGPDGVIVTEWALRLPSLLAYCCSVFLFCYAVWKESIPVGDSRDSSKSVTRQCFLVGLLSLALSALYFGLDRIQLFYATEARVYSMVQALSLAGWLLVFAQFSSRESSGASKTSVALLFVWFGVALLLIHLHLVTVVVVAWQAALLTAVWLWRSRKFKSRIVLFVGLAAASILVCLPLVWDYLFVWERRQQWTRFAGDASWSALVSQFPIAPLLVPAVAALVLDFFVGALSRKLGRSHSADKGLRFPWLKLLGWSLAWLGPLLTAWLLTWFEVAPLMHRRYLIFSAIPMVMLAAMLLVRIRYRAIAFVAVGVSAFWLINVQPTLEIWQGGQVLGTQRGEYWREASQWVQARYEDGDQLWCACDLIEGDSLVAPLSERDDAYLSFPLRGIYAIRASDGDVVKPHALVSDAGQWLVEWQLRDGWSVGGNSEKTLFLVARTSAKTLEQIILALRPIAESEGVQIEFDEPVQDFVFLSAVRLTLKKPVLPR